MEFADVPAESAPVVMTVRGQYLLEVENWGGPVPIRMIGDRHFLPLMSTERFAAALRDPFPSHAYSTIPHFQFIKDIYNPIRRRLYDDLANYGGMMARPWPSAIEHLIREGSSRHIFDAEAKAFDGSGGKIALDDDAVAESERYRDYFAKGFEGYVVVDGVVFRPIPEPCYQVDVDSGIISAVIPFGLFPNPYNPSEAQLFSSATHFFAADQLDEAKELSRTRGKDRFALELLEMTGCAVDVLDPRALLGHDYAAAGLHRTAREIRQLFTDDAPPAEVAQTVLELNQALEASEDAYNVSPDLERAVRAAVALEDVAPDWYNRRVDVETGRRIAFQLERQDSRPIEFSLRQPKL
ncbi:hypothetical protein OIU34_23960 [Pararhizobium sp. BT-229]|uniref:hypothetical protein n=1 Tax=Pararhizobium sp. BT-229 TaxID=2986923 RepID=UPI0021F7776F|nr:hypothetical protein [Pararhizobium sp. BT-229]MCV9964954.1 hypothetical protein [Pararhizobium sp. BT-229]